MTEMQWWKKAGIGAIGGLALAILKLIEAKFFLPNFATTEAYAGYLTYGCYMLLGSVTAIFLADHELPPPKLRRSAFILGLLAPSVLLALTNQPFKPGEAEVTRPVPGIPALSWIPLPSALAQPVPAATSALQPIVQIVPESAFEPRFADAFAAAVGRKQLGEPYVYVVGATPDKNKALDTAQKVGSVTASGNSDATPLQVRVVQVKGQPVYYVIVGDLASRQSLVQAKIEATSAAIKSIDGPASGSSPIEPSERKAIAELLVQAPVVPARDLVSNAKR